MNDEAIVMSHFSPVGVLQEDLADAGIEVCFEKPRHGTRFVFVIMTETSMESWQCFITDDAQLINPHCVQVHLVPVGIAIFMTGRANPFGKLDLRPPQISILSMSINRGDAISLVQSTQTEMKRLEHSFQKKLERLGEGAPRPLNRFLLRMVKEEALSL